MTHQITNATVTVVRPSLLLVSGTERGRPTKILLDALGRAAASAGALAGRTGLTATYDARGQLLSLTC